MTLNSATGTSFCSTVSRFLWPPLTVSRYTHSIRCSPVMGCGSMPTCTVTVSPPISTYGRCLSFDASTVLAVSRSIFSPQQISGTPWSSISPTRFPQCLQR